MPGLQAALPTGDIEGCADANTQVITVTSITDDFEAYCTFALESKPELCAARTACTRAYSHCMRAYMRYEYSYRTYA